MRCEAVQSGLPDKLVHALDGLRPEILERVVGPCLHRPDISCAGFYVRRTDTADLETHQPFCEVRLSGVSVTDDRTLEDFRRAHNQLRGVYRETILAHLRPGQSMKLFVVLMLDMPPEPGMSPFIESEEVLTKDPQPGLFEE